LMETVLDTGDKERHDGPLIMQGQLPTTLRSDLVWKLPHVSYRVQCSVRTLRLLS
jgi:hypothetical protein